MGLMTMQAQVQRVRRSASSGARSSFERSTDPPMGAAASARVWGSFAVRPYDAGREPSPRPPTYLPPNNTTCPKPTRNECDTWCKENERCKDLHGGDCCAASCLSAWDPIAGNCIQWAQCTSCGEVPELKSAWT